MKTLKHPQIIDFIARICLSAVFINAIPNKITNFSNVVQFISNRGIPEQFSMILLVLAIIILIAGSFLIIVGKQQKVGAILLLLFIIPTTIIFHLYPFQSRALLLNLGLCGGLLLILNRK